MKGGTYAVEGIYESLPNLHIAPPLAFVVEAVNSRDIGTFVVASQEEEVLRVFYFVAHEQQNSLQGMFSTIDVISEEEEVCAWWESAHFKHANEI